MRKRKRGFTLVELLAVIVILAVILVIAVPSIMSVIEDSKKGSLESSTKMIASSAETKHVSNQTLGITEDITCESVSNYSSSSADFKSCDIVFDSNGKATVTLIGKGRFDKLKCTGTKNDATCGEYVEGRPGPAARIKASSSWITDRPKDAEGNYTFSTTNVTEIEFVRSLPFSEDQCLEKWNAGIDNEENKVLVCLSVQGVAGNNRDEILSKLIATYDAKNPNNTDTEFDCNYGDEIEIYNCINPTEYSAKLYIVGTEKGVKANQNSSYMFAHAYYDDYGLTDWARLNEIKGLDLLDTSEVTDMSYMFDAGYYSAQSYRAYLNKLDLSNFNTSNVENMSYMFQSNVMNLDLSSFNTEKVTSMEGMFSQFSGQLNLSSFNTKKVTNMGNMFSKYGEYNKTIFGTSVDLDLSKFEISDECATYNMLDYISVNNVNKIYVSSGSKVNLRESYYCASYDTCATIEVK